MAHSPKLRWWLAALLFSGSALSFFDRQALSVLAPRILNDLAMTNIEYSHAVSAFTLAYSVMFTVGGRLIDIVGTRLGLGIAVIFWTIASLLHAAVGSSAQLSVSRFLLGIGEGGYFPGSAKCVLERFPARDRALAMGIATTGGSAIGAVIAPPLIVWMTLHAGWRGAFLATGLIGAAWVILWFPSSQRPAGSGPNSESEGRRPDERSPLPWRALLTRRDVWGLTLTRFLLDPVFYFYMFWIPQYLHQERGASLADIGRLSWIPFLTLGLSSPVGGSASDLLVRHGWPVLRARKAILSASAFLTPVSILALYAPNSFWAVVLLGVLMFAHGFWMTNYMTLISDLFPASSVGTVVGLTGTFGGVGGFLSSLLIGSVVESYSFAPVFIVCGVLYPVGLAIILATTRAKPGWR